ncbi:MAG: DNA-binding protein [Flavobacteriales bacterium CG18_big_fil_WC_8_21_14_2_50_32_9]|nr:cold shock domain-containing protein [Vicingaceae bacterium]PIQ17029.1 MAG: DNA-binding protein [Flavobacteriales bacterium CG18_big_fil_WC_8_21_14_2_50_32_9]PIZ06375.1 MAG: DNA-binding protein [Flavobacteriales bacterium CG_4_10_14_0_8_um_filter_32_5]PJC63283.1 MAG: DNA-binding protein [Flavobacteriales bacterium CG_4_9_14_0_2_um_filter_32_27]
MAKSQQTYNKKEIEKKRLKKRQDKLAKKEDRKSNTGGGFDSMIAYVDEYGRITDTPPDPTKKKKVIDADSIEIGVSKRVNEEVNPFRKGKVSFFDTSKGYGFILDTDNQEKYFVHVSGLIDEIGENDKVSFELEQGQKGLNAVRVKKV